MNVRFENLGLYNIDTDYLRYLNGIEPEVHFTQDKDYEQKPLVKSVQTVYIGPYEIQKQFRQGTTGLI